MRRNTSSRHVKRLVSPQASTHQHNRGKVTLPSDLVAPNLELLLLNWIVEAAIAVLSL